MGHPPWLPTTSSISVMIWIVSSKATMIFWKCPLELAGPCPLNQRFELAERAYFGHEADEIAG